MKKSKEKLLNEKKLAFDAYSKSTDSYEPKPIKWKKVFIVLFIIALVCSGAFLIWFFVFKGKDYLSYKDQAKSFYQNTLVVPNKENIQKFEYVNEELKQSALSLIDSIENIYINNKGFNFVDGSGDSFKDYKYKSSRTIEIISISSNDYLFGFVDKNVVPSSNKNESFPKYMTNRFSIRVRDNKITAIGFRFDDINSWENRGYRWMTGSYTENMVGK